MKAHTTGSSRLAPIVAAAILLGSPGLGRAQSRDALDLVWQAPPGCPSDEAVERRAKRHLEESELGEPRSRVDARIVVRRAGSKWRAELELEGTVAGRRTLEADSCDSLAEAAALVVALALQADPAPQPEPEPEPEEKSRSPAESPDSPAARQSAGASDSVADDSDAVAREPERRRSWRPRFAVGLAGLVDSAALPRPAAGVGALAALDAGPIHSILGIQYFPPLTAEAREHPTAGAVVDLTTVRAQGCYALIDEPLRAGPCVGVEIGALRARGEGVTRPADASTLWLAATAGAAASAPAGPLLLRAQAAGLLPARRPRFVVDGNNEAYEVRRWGIRAGLAILWAL